MTTCQLSVRTSVFFFYFIFFYFGISHACSIFFWKVVSHFLLGKFTEISFFLSSAKNYWKSRRVVVRLISRVKYFNLTNLQCPLYCGTDMFNPKLKTQKHFWNLLLRFDTATMLNIFGHWNDNNHHQQFLKLEKLYPTARLQKLPLMTISGMTLSASRQ